MVKDNPNLLDGFATDENSLLADIPALLESMGWSLTNSKINGMQMNTLFNQIFGYLNFLQSKGLSFWQDDKPYVADANNIDIVRRGNKIYFAKQNSNTDPVNAPAPKAPESNADYWGVLLDLDKPIFQELAKYALKNGNNQNLFKVKDGVADDEAVNIKQLKSITLESLGGLISALHNDWVNKNIDNKVVGLLPWNNYGNSHVICDMSKGITHNGLSKNNTDSDYEWSPLKPTLMGFNGVDTYGVRVDTARNAENLGGLPASAYQNNLVLLADYPSRKYAGTITLSRPITDFKFLVVKQTHFTDIGYEFIIIPTDLLIINELYRFSNMGASIYAYWKYINPTTFTMDHENATWIRSVYGMGEK